MNKTEIINEMKANGGAEIAALQLKFGMPYRVLKAIVDEFVADGTLVFESGIKYAYVEKSAADPFETGGEINGSKSVTGREGYENDSQEETDVEKAAAERLAALEARREAARKKVRESLSEDGEEDDIDEKFFDQYLSDDDSNEVDTEYEDIADCMFHSDADESNNIESEEHKEKMQAVATVLGKNTDRKTAPIAVTEMPLHPSWDDEEEFENVVIERMIRLIKSDRRMGRIGAVKKAENYLEAVMDSCDEKMIEVYERLVYEMKNISSYLYGQLKKQCFDE